MGSEMCIRDSFNEFKQMEKWVCDVCGYIYDPEIGDPDNGIAAGTAFADLPEDWVCPLCGVGKDQFSKQLIIISKKFRYAKLLFIL